MELCDNADTSPGIPPHCAAVQHRDKPFAYVSLAEASGYTVVHAHRGLGTKFFTCEFLFVYSVTFYFSRYANVYYFDLSFREISI
jgi:hypothetical protein